LRDWLITVMFRSRAPVCMATVKVELTRGLLPFTRNREESKSWTVKGLVGSVEGGFWIFCTRKEKG
jgi:hypothetical protein